MDISTGTQLLKEIGGYKRVFSSEILDVTRLVAKSMMQQCIWVAKNHLAITRAIIVIVQ